MFSRISFLTVSALAILATAMPNNPPATTTVTVTAPAPTGTPIPASQCNVSGLQCCDTLQAADSSAVSGILGLLGVVVQGVTALVGVTCTPISVLGIGQGGACSAQPVCCSNNDFHGIVAIGCVPINIGL